MINEIDDARCWPEDYEHENGCYYNRCCDCKEQFLGYKRRVICKMCAKIHKPTLTDDEKKVLLEKIMALSEQIADYEKTRTEYTFLLDKEIFNLIVGKE